VERRPQRLRHHLRRPPQRRQEVTIKIEFLPARQIIHSYARRINIEQRLAEAIQSFGLDALAGAVPLNVDLDVVLSVLDHTVCAALRRRLPGYHARHSRHPPAALPVHRRHHRKPPNPRS
jgi:hypothetical protein